MSGKTGSKGKLQERGSLVFRKKSKASPTPSRRRGCAAHAGESWRFLGGTRFSLCGRVELLRRMGRVTTVQPGRVTTAKDPTSAASGGPVAIPQRWPCSRFGRYRHLPPNPRRRRPIPRRSWVIFFRGVWLFGCSKQGQPDAQKAAGLCRACWGILEILGWNPFFTLRAGRVTTANG